MRVLVACEYSGAVRRAFEARGHLAVSCDLLPADDGGNHHQGDVLEILGMGWDLMVCHPPCTHLAVSGSRHFPAKRADGRQAAALDFVRALLAAPIPRIALENPVSIISTQVRKPDQIIQPWQFGHPEFKATCLWLKGLPKLTHTNVLTPPEKGTPEYKAWEVVHRMPPGPNRWKERSVTFAGIAEAMADQWGGAVESKAHGRKCSNPWCNGGVCPSEVYGAGATCRVCDGAGVLEAA